MFCGAGAAEVEQIVADLDLRKEGFIADDQRLSRELDRQRQIPTVTGRGNFWIICRPRLAELRVRGLRSVPRPLRLRIGPESKVD